MARSSHHVVHNPNGGWDVKRGGAQRSSGHYSTKEQAINAGRQISRNQGTEFVIHGLAMEETLIRRKADFGKTLVSKGSTESVRKKVGKLLADHKVKLRQRASM